MANQEQLELLKQFVGGWNEWRLGSRGVDIDLIGANLRDADLRDAILDDADLQDADLQNADLQDADLQDAILFRANLTGANLVGANLTGANLTEANLTGANLEDANLVGANLAGANLEDADLVGANLAEANLSDANLTRANLQWANLQKANLAKAKLEKVMLYEANLRWANLKGADLTESNLVRAVLLDAILTNANFENVIREKDAKEINKRKEYVISPGRDKKYFHWEKKNPAPSKPVSRKGYLWANSEQEILKTRHLIANLRQVKLEQAKIEKAEREQAIREHEEYIKAIVNQERLAKDRREQAEKRFYQERREKEKLEQEKREQAKLEQEKFRQIKRQKFKDRYRVSITHARLLSKRFSSMFLVQIYLSQAREEVEKRLDTQFKGKEKVEISESSNLEKGQKVRLHFSSSDIIFSDAITKKLDQDVNVTNFIAKPKDSCEPGEHQVILSITDTDSKVELESYTFTVTVTDFVFDHVSRPLLSKVSSAVLGVGSLAMFLLTLMGEIDTTFGLTSGTVAGALASGVILQFSRFYQRPATVHMP